MRPAMTPAVAAALVLVAARGRDTGEPAEPPELFPTSITPNVLLEAQFVWMPRALDAWLSQPGRFLPGNRMTFVGVGDAEDRADLIACLLIATDE